MVDRPSIKVTGEGSLSEAARLGQTIGEGAASALANHGRSLRIESLRVQLRAGAGKAEIERAIRAAIRRELQGGRN